MRKVPQAIDWDEFGRVAMGAWEIAPSEFRAMTPREFWLIYDAKANQARAASGSMKLPTRDEVVAFERGVVDRRREKREAR